MKRPVMPWLLQKYGFDTAGLTEKNPFVEQECYVMYANVYHPSQGVLFIDDEASR